MRFPRYISSRAGHEGARFKMISSKEWNSHSCFIARLTKRVSIPVFRCGFRARIESRTFSVVAIRRVEVMQGNFGKTIKADRNGSASHSNRGVANHIAILP
jgi:hypothetical protein